MNTVPLASRQMARLQLGCAVGETTATGRQKTPVFCDFHWRHTSIQMSRWGPAASRRCDLWTVWIFRPPGTWRRKGTDARSRIVRKAAGLKPGGPATKTEPM